MYKYKSKDGSDFFIPGVGKSVNGVITTDEKLESHSLILIEEPQRAIPAPAVTAPVTPPVQPVAPPVSPAPINNEEQK